MIEAGIDQSEFQIIPFPIEKPEILSEFLPTKVPIFTTIYDEWNRYKVKELEQLGYRIIVLWERDVKEFEGIDVRRKIVEGDRAWESLVPLATVEAAKQYDLKARLHNLQRKTRP